MITGMIWGLFCLVDGAVDAFMFHKAYKANDFDNKLYKLDIHTFLFARRLVVTGALAFAEYGFSWKTFLVLVGMTLIQPFLHNGMYFHTRNHLNHNVYVGGFFYTKTEDDSSALLDFDSAATRIYLYVVGMLIFWSFYFV